MKIKTLIMIFLILLIGCEEIEFVKETSQEEIEFVKETSQDLKESSYYIPVPSIFQSSLKSLNNDSMSLFIDPLLEEYKDGLVLYFPFNDSTQDRSGNEFNGTVMSGVTGNLGNFNDWNDSTYIKVEDNDLLDFNNNFSLCAWYNNNKKGIDIGQGLLGKPRPDGGSGYYLSVSNTENRGWQDFPYIVFGINQGYTNDQGIYGGNCSWNSDGVIIGWHFVVGTYDSENLKLYIDGNLTDSSEVKNINLQNSDYPFFVGRECKFVDGPGTVRYFYGMIDNVMIYDYAISDTLVSNLYNLRIK